MDHASDDEPSVALVTGDASPPLTTSRHHLASNLTYGLTRFTPPPADAAPVITLEEAYDNLKRQGFEYEEEAEGPPDIFLAMHQEYTPTAAGPQIPFTEPRLVWVVIYHGVAAVGSGPAPPPGTPPQPPDVQISDVILPTDATSGALLAELTTGPPDNAPNSDRR